jgi:hypothetical protein
MIHSLMCQDQQLVRGWHQLTVVLSVQEVGEWVARSAAARTRALWSLLRELVETTGKHSPWVDARGDPVAFDWILPGALRDGPPWVPTPTGTRCLPSRTSVSMRPPLRSYPRNLLVGCPARLRSWRAPPWRGVGKDALATCGKLRDELFDREIFFTLQEAQVLIERRRQHDNGVRPHSALGYRPPAPEARARPPLALLPRSELELTAAQH